MRQCGGINKHFVQTGNKIVINNVDFDENFYYVPVGNDKEKIFSEKNKILGNQMYI